MSEMHSEKPSLTKNEKLLFFFKQEIGSAIYAMIRPKLVPLISINYDLCSLTVLFSHASENNHHGITQPSSRKSAPSHLSVMPQ